jgi:hypothetical protein
MDGQRIEGSRRFIAATLTIGHCKLQVAPVANPDSGAAEPVQIHVRVLYSTPKLGRPTSSHTAGWGGAWEEHSQEADDTREVSSARRGGEEPVQPRCQKDSLPRAAEAWRKPLQELTVGTAVEFHFCRERGIRKVLSLKSFNTQHDVYFFQDQPSSDETLCLTARHLARCFRERSAQVVHSRF